MFIAEDFTQIYNLLGGYALVFVVLAIIGFLPASRGHWSAVVLAAPALAVGGYYTGLNLLDSHRDQILGLWWFLCAVPFVVGACSFGCWAACRHAKRLAATDTKA